MKKPNIFDFSIWNPLKKGIYISLVFNFTKKDYSEYYFLIGLGFCQFSVDLKMLYLEVLNTLNKYKL
jgi:hypothetical protein